MSGVFSEREKAFENKWAHDEELRFKVLARRNRLLGLWAAREMGVAEAEDYANTLVQAQLAPEGDKAVFAKLKSDFAARNIPRSDHLLELKMEEFLKDAKAEIIAQG